MVADYSFFKHGHNVEVISSYLISLTFLLVIALFVVQLFRKCTECCKFKDNKYGNIPKDSIQNKYMLINKKRSNAVSGHGGQRSSVCISSLESYRNANFEIPGMVSCESIQPTDSSSASGSGSLGGSVDEYINNRYLIDEQFVEEFIQPEPGETLIPIQGAKSRQYRRSPDHRISTHLEAGVLEAQLNRELYEASSNIIQGSSSLGKLVFTLQYEDNSKKKLIMTLLELSNLRFSKLNENVEAIILAVTLLPEREYVYKTKELERANKMQLTDSFTFHSRPRNRDFESRTVVVSILLICPNSGKEMIYGEARLPLLSHEIYSQVSTKVSVGLRPMVQNEVGDAQIQISYSSTQQLLTVLVKMIHFTNVTLLDKLSGIHIKTYLVSLDNEKLSKKKVLSKNVRVNDSVFVEFQESMSFKLALQNYSMCTMKMSIHGKHKLMVKHLNLGKIRIGENSNEDCGQIHWKTALTSQEIAWTMWHPIRSG